MALSRIVIPGDGSTTQFVVSFALGYIKEEDVTCRVGNEADGGGNPIYRTITWLTPSLAQISGSAPAPGVRVIFERSVVRDDLLVDYEDGDILNEDNLNLSQKQCIMLVHEVLDGRFAALQNDVDMGTFRITGLGDPVDQQDAATKAYVDARIVTGQSSAAAAAASAGAAASSASAALGSAGNANSSAGAAANSAVAANGFANTAQGYAQSAGTARDDALTYRDQASEWAIAPEDTIVNDGTHTGYSAYHWAQKAAEFVAGVVSVAGLTGTVSDVDLKDALDISNVTDSTLAEKADAAAVTSALSGKSDVGHVHAAATTSVNGFMSADDKSKLDGMREVLTADRTYYVRTNGNDGNNGLSNTAGGAFQTLAKAAAVVQTLDFAGFGVTISVAAGTYTAGFDLAAPTLGGLVTVSGAGATTIIHTTATDAVRARGGAGFNVENIRLQTTTSGDCIRAEAGSTIWITGSVTFGACAGAAHMNAAGGTINNVQVSNTIAGACARHLLASDGGSLQYGMSPVTHTLTGSIAFSAHFATSTRHGRMSGNAGWSGSATGTRYIVDTLSLIQTYGSGSSYFPGNSSGSVSSGGQYA